MAKRFWFARRFPVSDPRKSVAPVSAEGWIMVAAFVLDLIAGAVVFFYLASIDQAVTGALAFAVLAASGAGVLLFLASRKSDQAHTVEDYRAGRVS